MNRITRISRILGGWMALGLLPMLPPVAAAENVLRVGTLSDASLSKLTHATCTYLPATKAAAGRYLLVEGPACPVGGGECRNVALMRINGRVVELARTAVIERAAGVTPGSDFESGAMSLKLRYGKGQSASLQVTANGQTVTLRGIASCGAD